MSREIEDLHPKVQEYCRELITQCIFYGIRIIITQTLRTIEEQDELYARGRTKPGPVVTNAKGGSSYHNYRLAFDFAVQGDDGKTIWDPKVDENNDGEPDYAEIGAIGEAFGLEWGGHFKTIKGDLGHFQYTFGLSIADLKAGKRPPEVEEKTT